MPSSLATAAFLTLALTACATRPAGGLSAADEAAIEDASRAWLAAAARKDANAVAALYTEDAVLMSPNRPVPTGPLPNRTVSRACPRVRRRLRRPAPWPV